MVAAMLIQPHFQQTQGSAHHSLHFSLSWWLQRAQFLSASRQVVALHFFSSQFQRKPFLLRCGQVGGWVRVVEGERVATRWRAS